MSVNISGRAKVVSKCIAAAGSCHGIIDVLGHNKQRGYFSHILQNSDRFCEVERRVTALLISRIRYSFAAFNALSL